MRTPALVRFFLAGAAFVLGTAGFSASPCDPGWRNGYGMPGVGFTTTASSYLRASMEMPNGDVIVAGDFNIIGTTPARRIARFDRASRTWNPLGTGISGTVHSLTLLPNGDLIAAGKFSEAGGVPSQSIARWDGSAWSALGGGGTSDTFYTVLALPNGHLIAGGAFSYAGSTPARNIAEWTGSSWSAMGSGIGLNLSSGASVRSLAQLASGEIVAGGHFETAGSTDASCIARWDGTTWKPFGSGVGTGGYPLISAMLVRPDGTLLVGGSFDSIDGISADNLASFDGLAWHAVGSGVSGSVYAIGSLDNGELLAGGSFAFAGKSLAASIARWDGSQWHQVGGGVGGSGGGTIFSITRLSDNSAVVGGQFTAAGETSALNGAFWNGSAFSAFAPAGLDGAVRAIAQLPSGDFVLAGEFTQAGSSRVNRIVRWDGTAFHDIGAGMSANVSALAVLPGGDLIAGGDFTYVSGRLALRIARWNGVEWVPLGSGVSGSVKALLALPDGSLVVGGAFATAGGMPSPGIARWDGIDWTGLGAGVSGGTAATATVYSLARTPQGEIVAAGEFAAAGGTPASNIARWNGVSWSAFGQGVYATTGTHRALAVRALQGGDIVVAGTFSRAGAIDAKNIARWSGQEWSAFSAGIGTSVYALGELADGSLLAGGSGIAKWTGTQWETFSDGTDTRTIVGIASGDILIGGNSRWVGWPATLYSQYFARFAWTGAPILGTPPTATTSERMHSATLFAALSVGFTESDIDAIRWRRDSAPISDGPGGASPGGGVVTGATTLLRDGRMRLDIDDIQLSDTGNYDVVVINACGEQVSRAAALTVRANVADLNADGVVNDDDFQLFAAQYDVVLCSAPEMPDACSADLNDDGGVDDHDFVLFVWYYTEMTP